MENLKITLDVAKERLLNKFENDFYSLTIAAYLQAQNRGMSKNEQDEFVLSLLEDAKKKYYETVIDLGNDLFL